MAVTITLLLAYNAILQNIFYSVIKDEAVKFAIAGPLAVISMLVLIFTTSLKKDFLRCCKKSSNTVV